ncbi:unnamed protein product [Prunus armeniaca]|uniref:Uncharacterized protein n=1 Tax=Prunus armeniaca TaxID=36596 RepID=A0A6J5TLT5_PRUAR|nr:unnamed protein product [Prunus armeniaca]
MCSCRSRGRCLQHLSALRRMFSECPLVSDEAAEYCYADKLSGLKEDHVQQVLGLSAIVSRYVCSHFL